jgi:GAF domain-containing protein
MAVTVDERLAQAFVKLADTLVVGYDLIEFLQTLTDQCVDLLEVDAAGLLLADSRGALRLVAASTEQARVVELFQIQNDEGPCLDCYRTGQAVIVSDIRADWAAVRWPQFAAATREMGYAGVHAIPMRLRDQVIGTLNLFKIAPTGWTRRSWWPPRHSWTWPPSASCRNGPCASMKSWPGNCNGR